MIDKLLSVRHFLTATLIFLLVACSQPTEPIDMEMGDDVRLSKGICPIIHCNTYQTDALPVRGPQAPTQTLDDKVIDHLWSSPIAGGHSRLHLS